MVSSSILFRCALDSQLFLSSLVRTNAHVPSTYGFSFDNVVFDVSWHCWQLFFNEMLEDISMGQTSLWASDDNYLSICGVVYYSYLKVLEATAVVNC
jgi:hypothetical protein